MTWSAHHRRHDVLRAVVDEANRRRDGQLPTGVPGVAETFADDLDLVAALALRWHTRLSGRIDRALLDEPADLEHAVVAAWTAAAEELPGVRAVLDAQLGAPASEEIGEALTRARTKERRLLAAMAGLAALSDDAAPRVGARIEGLARELWAAPRPLPGPRPGHRSERAGLLGRIRAVLAA